MLQQKAKLNRVYNEVMDLLDREDVNLEVFGYSAAGPSLSTGEGDQVSRLFFNEATRTYAYNQDRPPVDFDAFIARQTDIHVAKNTDYGSRYVKALMEFGSIIWTWEVQKKLDRIRSWIQRGQLLVKGEGLNNAVGDLFNYTVQYEIYKNCHKSSIDPFQYLGEITFNTVAQEKTPNQWVDLLVGEGLIGLGEADVILILLTYMGVKNA